jgi:hypothetical protein
VYSCNFCQRSFSNKGGLATHEPYCPSNPDRVRKNNSPLAHRPKGIPAWNKGKKSRFPAWNKGKTGLRGTPHSAETKDRLSEHAKKRNLGGYVRGSGRGKKGWYKGIFCDSSWELALVIYCIDHSIVIERNLASRTYIWDGEIRKYLPDFIVDGSLVEVKGYSSPQWQAKLDANPDIVVYGKSAMQPILKYIVDNYGRDYIRLYE